MKAVVILVLVAVAATDKISVESPHLPTPAIAILKDERVHPDAQGNYVFDIETEDGVVRHESGGAGGSQQGFVSYTAPDGTPVNIRFVADEKGYQPESELLPVAPAFPHPIPQFVLDQIAKAAEEEAARPRPEVRESSGNYESP